ncbi:actin depolymerizing protein [Microthyrium microscopicum]|uniref:Actin depolymerizing protein n=1 Tax=Microthyrium microscopicum TaxID=703497 RepID=A0A6A6UN75_9PEZI|nr:actin depolymerizing protein [Microthyrium microscopicum]
MRGGERQPGVLDIARTQATYLRLFLNRTNMSAEARLYTFSQETKDKLRKFRLGTSRAKDPQAIIYQIDRKTYEIVPEDDQVYTNMQELADELPDHAPRFILLSYPLELASGRLSVPYVMLYYLPVTTKQDVRMTYAGAKELMRNTSEVGKIIDIETAEELENIEEKLKSEA